MISKCVRANTWTGSINDIAFFGTQFRPNQVEYANLVDVFSKHLLVVVYFSSTRAEYEEPREYILANNC